MATHKPVKPDPQQIENAENLWKGFTVLMKYSTIIAVAVVAVLGLVFIDW